MKLYKLTDLDWTTRGGTKWGPGITHKAADPGVGDLCGPGWIHAYEHPLLAVLHDPIHGAFGPKALLWECSTTDRDPLRDGQMKLGVRILTTVRQIEMPAISDAQRVHYAILCAWQSLRGCRKPWAIRWRRWAREWISGLDRSAVSAVSAASAVWEARQVAVEEEEEEGWPAEEAADTAWEAAVEEEEEGAAWRAALAAAWTTERANNDIDLIRLAERAIKGGADVV